MIAAIMANHYHLPLVASWHTNVHEYAAKRSQWFLKRLPEGSALAAAQKIEDASLFASARFYSLARGLVRAKCRTMQFAGACHATVPAS